MSSEGEDDRRDDERQNHDDGNPKASARLFEFAGCFPNLFGHIDLNLVFHALLRRFRKNLKNIQVKFKKKFGLILCRFSVKSSGFQDEGVAFRRTTCAQAVNIAASCSAPAASK